MKLKYLLAPLVFFASVMFVTASYAEGELTGVSAPATAVQGATVTITVTGSGSCPSSITYGDGGSDSIGNSAFPHTYTHPYTSTGVKTISVNAPTFGCSGSDSTTINITAAVPDNPTISSITGSSCAKKGASYKIKVNGSGGTGICATLNVNWGAGEGSNNYTNHNLTTSPWRSHTYNMLGSRTINASGSGGCAGSATKTITVKNSCIYVLDPNLFRKMVFKIWVKPPWPWPPCLSCPPWIKDIRWREAQMRKYSKLAQKPGKRQAYYMRQFKMHKAARARTIGKYNRAKNRAMKLKGGAVMKKAPAKRMAPGKRMQMK